MRWGGEKRERGERRLKTKVKEEEGNVRNKAKNAILNREKKSK